MTFASPRSARATAAMVCVGLAIFSGLYTTQALMPVLISELGLSSTAAALTVSAATGGLALCVVPASILSERYGRGRILMATIIGASALGLAVPLAQTGPQLIALRGVQGVVMAGAPATAMAWLAEELDPRYLPRAMGLYIAGTSLGGLTGRLVPVAAVEFFSWRGALWASAAVSLACAVAALFLLPAQRNFRPKPIHLRGESVALARHLKDPRLVGLYATAFLAMGVFVSLYNFIGIRLIEDLAVAPILAGGVFIFYLSGTWASARAGALIERWGRRATLGGAGLIMALGALCAAGPLWTTIPGMLAFTAGFFAAHSTASGWVGARATRDRAEASSMYVLCYYLGSSVVGAAFGAAFDSISWAAYAGLVAAGGAAVALIALYISD